jgi:2-keto-4-pentenoate hydratase
MRSLIHFALVLVCALSAPSIPAAMPPGKAIDALAEDYLAVREARGFSQRLTLPEALVVQRSFVRKLQPSLGKPVGYKVGLVTREAQERFGVEAPLRGVLLEKMLLPNRTEVPPNFAVRPILEADLIVVVKDKAINDARSIPDVAAHLKEVVAFMELPDSYIATNPPPYGALLAAGNVGARLGILGQRLPVRDTAQFVQALADMKVTIVDSSGAELGRGEGRVILDHPLNAVLWLMEELHQAGVKLKPGDLLSLGSIKAVPVPSSKSVTVKYEGLPGGPIEATAHFR